MNTHLIICNRTPAAAADGWLHVVPKGELRNGALTQVLDERALDLILANIDADRAKLGDKWPGIYAGREHFIYNSEQDSAALGWFKDFEKRADGIYAKADGLTPIGEQALRNKEYKFTSFVTDRADTEDLGGGRHRIRKIETIGFTNLANGRHMLNPMVNKQSPAAASAAADQHQQQQRNHTMKTIAAKLGLSAEASEDAILTAITPLLNRGDISPDALKQLCDENTALKNRNTELESEQITGLLDHHQVTDEKLRNRFTGILTPLKNRDERAACLVEFGFEAGKGKPAAAADSRTRLLNREARTPADRTAAGGESEADLARKAEVEITDFKLKNRCSYNDARNAVRAAKPELFGITK